MYESHHDHVKPPQELAPKCKNKAKYKSSPKVKYYVKMLVERSNAQLLCTYQNTNLFCVCKAKAINGIHCIELHFFDQFGYKNFTLHS